MLNRSSVVLKLGFFKGHMGGNTIGVLYGADIPEGKEVEVVALKALDPLHLSAHEVGILYPASRGGNVRVKVVGCSSRRFIPMCGGLTQVLGKLLIETDLGQRFSISYEEPTTRVLLETDDGLVEITIEVRNTRAERVHTDMTPVVERYYKDGVYAVSLCGVSAMRVGPVLVLNADDLREQYPRVNFEKMPQEAREVLIGLQCEFDAQGHMPVRNVDVALYDWHPKQAGDARVVFPHDLQANHVEPACGTGTVATGLAMLAKGEISRQGGTIRLECGDGPSIGGPELSSLQLRIRDGTVHKALFSHNVIEVTAMGELWL